MHVNWEHVGEIVFARQEVGALIVMEFNTITSTKVKVTLVQALRLCTGHTAHRWSRGRALLFHDHGTRRG
jgi:hypothetical protein